VAAPILAPPAGMRAGTAQLLVAGPAEEVEAARPGFDALGGPTKVVGTRVGTAAKLKLVSNQLLIGNAAVLAEAIATARAARIDDDELREFLHASVHVAPGLQNRIDRFVDGDVEAMFSIANAAKDLRLALELAKAGEESHPTTRAAASLLQRAIDDGHAGDDLSAIALAASDD
jgi:3-hydroxyisobutyrate dehydrogenase-like beta-hydroxyacid dehydrogenase